jgi:Protein of unknown function (DUF2961)
MGTIGEFWVKYCLLAAIVAITSVCLGQEPGPLDGLATLHSGTTSERASSWDRTGGNADYIVVRAGATVPLAEITGAGEIRHIWITINSPSPYHLRELVLRMYWDGETQPSVEVPVGDFFGTGFEFGDLPDGAIGQKYHSWQSLPITVYGKALNCYFPMPFGKGARITISNDGGQDVPDFYYHIDYAKYPDASVTAHEGRFHAQWRHQVTAAIPAAENPPVNLDGRNNYNFMQATGTGQFVGVILAVQGYSTGWWGEGDDMFFIDGATSPPSINGTGIEDYFGSAWGFGEEYNYPFVGYSVKGNRDGTGTHVMYRFHMADPIYFDRSIAAGIEHGHANQRQDSYTSVAFWYQTEPHQPLDPLPPLKDRLLQPFWRIQPLKNNLPN